MPVARTPPLNHSKPGCSRPCASSGRVACCYPGYPGAGRDRDSPSAAPRRDSRARAGGHGVGHGARGGGPPSGPGAHAAWHTRAPDTSSAQQTRAQQPDKVRRPHLPTPIPPRLSGGWGRPTWRRRSSFAQERQAVKPRRSWLSGRPSWSHRRAPRGGKATPIHRSSAPSRRRTSRTQSPWRLLKPVL